MTEALRAAGDLSPALEADWTLAEQRLRQSLRQGGPLLVAYSGGVDSAYLSWVAHQVLGDQLVALIADSPSLARSHYRDALAFAARHGIPCETIQTAELDSPEYAHNGADRCFFCKDELFHCMEGELERRPAFQSLAYGANADDRWDYRPGAEAARRHHVRAPLLEAGLGKAAIRALARQAGLELWDRPASPCLASRVVHGIGITPSVLGRIEAGEEGLRKMGFREFRARDHGDLVRIEIAPAELDRALNLEAAGALTRLFKGLGFRYVTLDLEGFRSGSLNPR
ncbi:MAG: ATP-dependent sacrificial sulfur transferase LarE [Terriglobales bacterium]